MAKFQPAITLLPLLRATPDSSLVLQSSELHRGVTGGVTFKILAEVSTKAIPTVLYNRFKLAQGLLVRALHQRNLSRWRVGWALCRGRRRRLS